MMKYFDLEEYLKNLEELVNTDSNSFDADGVDKVAAIMEKKYKDLGMSVKRHRFDDRAGYCLEVRNHPETDEIDILMVGHMDTVLPIGYTKEHPFRRDEKAVYGAGVLDMKSGLLNMYYVVKELLGDNTPLKMCLALNCDEEISSRYSNPWIRELAKKSKCGLVFEPARTSGALVNERKGLARFRVDFKGKYAHSGVNPWDGASAIHELAKWVDAIVPLNNYEIGTSLNVGLISGGIGANTVAEDASFEVDIRFESMDEYNRIKNALEDLKKKPFIKGVSAEVTRLGFRPPMHAGDLSKEFMDLMTECGREAGVDVQWVKTGGGSDGNFLAYEGCPVLDSVGPMGDGAHGVDEMMLIDSIKPRTEMVYLTLKKLTGSHLLNRKR